MAALGINLGFLLFQIFNFVILMVLLYAWAYKPITTALDNRKKAIAQGLEDARIAAEARANAEEEARHILAKAQAEASEKVREASERAEVAARDILNQAEHDSEKVRQNAIEDAHQERDLILAEMRGQVAALAMAAAQRLIGEAMDEKRQHILIDEFFSGVKAGKVVVLEEGAELRAATAEITSALPLTEAEKDTIRQEIVVKAGSQTVAFRVDPSILGGLVVKLGDKVLDGSVAGQLESLRQSLS